MGKFLTIDEFAGMEEGGVFWSEGFAPGLVGSKSVLHTEGSTYHRLSENSSGFSSFEDAKGMDTFFYGSKTDRVVTAPSTNMRIYEFRAVFNDNNRGLIHDAPSTSSPNPDVAYTQYSDILTTSNVNLLYSLGYSLGYATRGQCNSTSTTSITDIDGRDFTTLGIGTDIWNNKVYNLSTGEEHTITSIDNDAATNDRLNFTAGTYTNTAGDYFLVFSDIGAYNGGNYWDFFETTSYPHFEGQESVSSFRRQMKLYGDEYIIGNGNYLASLNVDETTWNDNYKQLPYNTQFRCMDVNQGRLLVGGDYYDRGKIMLWDGYSDGWLSILELPYVPTCIVAYGSGWIYTYNSVLYYTDGYTIQKLTTFPDRNSYQSGLLVPMNGMVVIDEKIHLITEDGTFKRDKQGMSVYEVGKGWNYHPLNNGNGNTMYGVNANCLELVGTALMGQFGCGGTNTRNIFIAYGAGEGVNEVIFKINPSDKRNIKRVGLKLTYNNNDYPSGASSVDVTASIGDTRKPFWKQFQTGNGSTTTTLVNTNGASSFKTAEVGQMLLVLEEDTAGERTFVTEIANPGTSTETYTVSPALSGATAGSVDVNILNLKKIGSKTINLLDIPEDIFFDVTGSYNDGFYLSLLFDGTNDVQIEQIDIYD